MEVDSENNAASPGEAKPMDLASPQDQQPSTSLQLPLGNRDATSTCSTTSGAMRLPSHAPIPGTTETTPPDTPYGGRFPQADPRTISNSSVPPHVPSERKVAFQAQQEDVASSSSSLPPRQNLKRRPEDLPQPWVARPTQNQDRTQAAATGHDEMVKNQIEIPKGCVAKLAHISGFGDLRFRPALTHILATEDGKIYPAGKDKIDFDKLQSKIMLGRGERFDENDEPNGVWCNYKEREHDKSLVSSHHCTITRDLRTFYLTDESMNGRRRSTDAVVWEVKIAPRPTIMVMYDVNTLMS